MCFGGTPKIESPSVTTVSPAPTPSAPEPAEETASSIAEKKRKQLAAIKYGIASTVKTSGTGDTSSVNLLLPAVVGSTLKEKLGQ